jgi:iron complex transport system permease protein
MEQNAIRPANLTRTQTRAESRAALPPLSLGRRALLILNATLLVAFMLSLAFGSVSIPLQDVARVLLGGEATQDTWRTIILTLRLPKALTATLAGAALACAGLKMQTLFRNPLADPFVLGISAGASLGVALVVLGTGLAGAALFTHLGLIGNLGVVTAASLGAGAVFGVVLLLARKVGSPVTLLVLGLMVSYMTGALVSALIYFSAPEQMQTYVMWTFGSFGGVTWERMRVFAPVLVIALVAAQLCAKPLNGLLLGESYARSVGLHVRHARMWIIAIASVMAGAVTAYCGPIGFIGVAVPHLARSLFHSSDHRTLLPAAMLLGATLALLFDLVAQMPGARFSLPLNVVTALVGAPVIVWVILRQRNLSRNQAS